MIAGSRLPMIPAHPQFARAVPAPFDAAAALRDHGRAGVRHSGHGTGRRRLRRCRAGRTCKTDRSRDGDRSQNCAQDVSPCDAIFAPGRSRATRSHFERIWARRRQGCEARASRKSRRARLKIQRGANAGRKVLCRSAVSRLAAVRYCPASEGFASSGFIVPRRVTQRL
jgi:hypothetical protein